MALTIPTLLCLLNEIQAQKVYFSVVPLSVNLLWWLNELRNLKYGENLKPGIKWIWKMLEFQVVFLYNFPFSQNTCRRTRRVCERGHYRPRQAGI